MGDSSGGSGTAGQLLHFLLEASPPCPVLASPIVLVSPTLQAGLPVRRPSQAQAGLWFISAAPAASLSRLVNRGSRQGRRRGRSGPCLASGLFWSPFQSSPRKPGSGLPDLTACEYQLSYREPSLVPNIGHREVSWLTSTSALCLFR